MSRTFPNSRQADRLDCVFGSRDLYRRMVLNDAKRAELPEKQPMQFEFVVNSRTGRQIGLTIPPNVLVRADRVIR
jgi:putative ABC transport system substrate-binding protein